MKDDLSLTERCRNIDHTLIVRTFPAKRRILTLHKKFSVHTHIKVLNYLFILNFFPERSCIKPYGLFRIFLTDFFCKFCYARNVCRMQGISSSRIRSMSACSGPPTWGMGSTSSRAQSTSERLEVTTFTM